MVKRGGEHKPSCQDLGESSDSAFQEEIETSEFPLNWRSESVLLSHVYFYKFLSSLWFILFIRSPSHYFHSLFSKHQCYLPNLKSKLNAFPSPFICHAAQLEITAFGYDLWPPFDERCGSIHFGARYLHLPGLIYGCWRWEFSELDDVSRTGWFELRVMSCLEWVTSWFKFCQMLRHVVRFLVQFL